MALRKIVLSLLAVGVASINPTALEKVTGYNVGASLLEASVEYGKYAEKLVNFESRLELHTGMREHSSSSVQCQDHSELYTFRTEMITLQF
eukprot:6186507-Amphidinium_carterae.1